MQLSVYTLDSIVPKVSAENMQNWVCYEYITYLFRFFRRVWLQFRANRASLTPRNTWNPILDFSSPHHINFGPPGPLVSHPTVYP